MGRKVEARTARVPTFDDAELEALGNYKNALVARARARLEFNKPVASPVARALAKQEFDRTVIKVTETADALKEVLLLGEATS